MLHLKLLEARNLSRRDLFSKSDPYCIMTVGSQSVTSKYIQDNQNPIWNQYFTFALPPQPQLFHTDLSIRVMDYDTFNSHEQLGIALIPLSSLQMTQNQWIDKWIPLSSARRGEIHIQMKMEPTMTSMQSQTLNYGMQQQQPMMATPMPSSNPGMGIPFSSNTMMPSNSMGMMMPQQQQQMMPMHSQTMNGYGMMPQQQQPMPQQPMQNNGYGMMPQQQMLQQPSTFGMLPQPQQQQQSYYPSGSSTTMYPSTINRGYY